MDIEEKITLIFMKPYKKSKRARTTMYNKEYKIVTNGSFYPYWNEGYNYYPIIRRGFWKKKEKRILVYKVRLYRTWKHNRKTQWKNGKGNFKENK
jgi:hypothetical protein